MMSAMSGDGEQLSAASEAEKAIVRYGITRVPVDYFQWHEFRYGNLDDALAQAKRAPTEQSPGKSSSAVSPDNEDEMLRYAITRIPVDNFYVREFRYTNLNDAIAQARRVQLASATGPEAK